MSLHTIKPEITYPALMPDIKRAMANLLHHYNGTYPVAVTRKTKELFYYDYQWIPWTNPLTWANEESYGNHILDWDDIYVLNGAEELHTLERNKVYTRHD